MAALLLARLHERPRNLRGAVEAAVAALQAIMQATVAAAGDAAHATKPSAEARPRRCFLRVKGRFQGL